MDNLNVNKPASEKDPNEPIPWDNANTGVSHSPLNLGGSRPSAPPPTPPPVTPPTIKKVGAKMVSSQDRVTGMKTFFAKLHVGSMEFIDEQISNWLKENPGVVVKHTNTTTGMVVSKVTEPNLIVTVWY
jgi:DNA-binding Lrp family transcriptional regulator